MRVFKTVRPPSRRFLRRMAARATYLGGASARLRSPWLPRSTAAPADEQRGQGIVEFALVASFLFLVLFGIVDFSRLFFAYATMANGVREGARFAVVHTCCDDAIIAAAHEMMVLIGDEATVTVAFPGDDNHAEGCRTRGCPVVVTARADLDVWTPVLPAVQIVTQSTMHIE